MIVGHIGGGVAQGYEIEKSLRFRASNSAYLSRTFGTPTSNTTWSFSLWVKEANINSLRVLLSSGLSSLTISSSNQLVIYNSGGGVVATASSVFRDPTAHRHLVFVSNGATVKAYSNGLEILSYVGSLPELNSAIAHNISRSIAVSTYHLDGYLSEINFIDGQALTPDAFGEFVNGVWVPKKYTGTYGNNGFYLPFDDGSNLTELCRDRSGNSNDWTASGISLTSGATYDWMDDTPTNSFAVFSQLNSMVPAGIVSAGLTINNTAGTYSDLHASTVSIAEGIWWYECDAVSIVNPGAVAIGVIRTSRTLSGTTTGGYGNTDFYGYSPNGQKFVAGVNSAYGATWTTGDKAGVLLDFTGGTLSITGYKKVAGVWTSQGVLASGLSGAFTPACMSYGSNNITMTFGQRPFDNTAPPSAAKALCTKNLTSDTITTSGTFTGNANADGPFVWLNGNPVALTINGNAVTWGTHADKTAGGFKVRSALSSYNAAGSNSYVVTTAGKPFNAPNNAQVNP